MPSPRSDDPPRRPAIKPIKPPICPDCDGPMRFDSGLRDTRYTNLRHMIFVCDCGRTADQLIADQE
jgi:hypothetical protein